MNPLRYAIYLLFHGSLNDFLPAKNKQQWIEHTHSLSSSVKDTIEAIGVPHVEIGKFLVNGYEQNFNYQPKPNDAIEIFPYQNNLPDYAPKSFVLDVHLGALARLLRMMGIDAVYKNDFDDNQIVNVAVTENRAVLTRDVGLLKHKKLQWGYWLRSQHAEEQTTEVIKQFSLCSSFHPFTRCIACNGTLYEVEKNEVLHLLPPQTKEYFESFYQCSNCKKVYWKGSHFQNMLQKIERLKSLACQ